MVHGVQVISYCTFQFSQVIAWDPGVSAFLFSCLFFAVSNVEMAFG